MWQKHNIKNQQRRRENSPILASLKLTWTQPNNFWECSRLLKLLTCHSEFRALLEKKTYFFRSLTTHPVNPVATIQHSGWSPKCLRAYLTGTPLPAMSLWRSKQRKVSSHFRPCGGWNDARSLDVPVGIFGGLYCVILPNHNHSHPWCLWSTLIYQDLYYTFFANWHAVSDASAARRETFRAMNEINDDML